MKTAKELVNDLSNIIDGEGEFNGNGRALASYDAEEIDTYQVELEEKIEGLEERLDDYLTEMGHLNRDCSELRKTFHDIQKVLDIDGEDYDAVSSIKEILLENFDLIEME